MKNVLGKYLFELIVIFVGITTSFLFEEWRQDQDENEKAIAIMESLVVELERNDLFIAEIDTTYAEVNQAIQSVLAGHPVINNDLAELCYFLIEGNSQVRLKDISSYIHGFSSADQLNLLDRNRQILRYLSYMESLLTEHELTTNAINTYANTNFWPVVHAYGIADDVILLQKGMLEMTDSVEAKSNADIKDFMEGEEVQQHMTWFQLKILRLIQINQAIHRQINNVKRELNTTIARSES